MAQNDHHRVEDWTLKGADDQPILGSTDLPDTAKPRLQVLFAHGFKGYKDYGFLPVLAARLARSLDAAVHRFNFSHSGMTRTVETFERPDLFERDTWSRQVFDIGVVDGAIRAAALPGAADGGPVVWMGHSRGGASCLLAAGRRARAGEGPLPEAIVTLAAPASTCSLTQEQRQQLREQGFLLSPSSRTGQQLRVGREWLEEIERDPQGHDLLALARAVDVPVLVVHGLDDPTVQPADAEAIAQALAQAELALIEGADHVFNTPNPADPQAPPSEALQRTAERIEAFLRRLTA